MSLRANFNDLKICLIGMYVTVWPQPLCWKILFPVVSNATFYLYSFVCVFVVRWHCTYFFIFCFVVNTGQMCLTYSETCWNFLHMSCIFTQWFLCFYFFHILELTDLFRLFTGFVHTCSHNFTSSLSFINNYYTVRFFLCWWATKSLFEAHWNTQHHQYFAGISHEK